MEPAAASSPSGTPERRHPHPAPARTRPAGRSFDVLVVGGGHAGVEAALAAARLGCRAGLLTQDADKLGEMSCNPAIGGLGKGQLAREVDALGGAMGRAIDATGIQFRMLNTRKGFAVQAPRAQADRHLYREAITRVVRAADGVEVVEGSAEGLVLETVDGAAPRVRGLRLADGTELFAPAVVLATGTFLDAVMHTGEVQTAGGRVGERTSSGMSRDLDRLGLRLGRLKTGTPPRLAHDSIDWEHLEPQHGDAQPSPFSFATRRELGAAFPPQPQLPCHITWTNEHTHAWIAANIHRAPMYMGQIRGTGARYCPSVEDKVMRFRERNRHQIFLEPEGLTTDVVYVNGISTSLPKDVQEGFVRSVEGLSRARFLRYGYAVEYDFVQPAQLDPTLAVGSVAGLYLAGQINGTSGYEEAAAQGLMAGANAALWATDRTPFVLGRHEAYTGVLVDDLVVCQPDEPYRMFSSRCEYRLLLRQDNADARLTPRAAAIGLASAEAAEYVRLRGEERRAAEVLLSKLRSPAHGGRALDEVLRRPEVTYRALEREHAELAELGLDPDAAAGLEADLKYAGYISRQLQDVARMQRQEAMEIPSDFDFGLLVAVRAEAREKLTKLRPRTLGAASRIAGINPPDIALLSVLIGRRHAAP